MSFLQIVLILSTFLCSLAAGFLFAFAIVIMPGIKLLNDGEFLRSFKVIDGVIQNNQPLFMLVWIGAVLALAASIILGISELQGINRMLIVTATLVYFLGVQLPTFAINVPLNNRLQQHDLNSLSEAALTEARQQFEHRWVKWNAIRTFLAILTSALLILLLFRL